ncbi:hypothetical protein T484DRAFT_1821113 [Baffinella frigidus]|nr:hypothetical protein T484DRAFT_1821113 [Cryptophyta sp. CCMP2293]
MSQKGKLGTCCRATALRVLIEAGGKELLMLLTKDGASCAHVASQNGHAEALRVLMDAGVDT